MAAVAKDPAIKLFGRTICLPETHFSEDSESLNNGTAAMTKAETEECRNGNSRTLDEAASIERCKGEQPETSLQQRPSNLQADLKSKDEHEESDGSDEAKLAKRPDKIVPCPRCNSLDTKFCYFNNYNVNQPRHFCKSCQRYWTAGGTVRNVPVGAGRRRNKHLASQYRHIVASSDGGTSTVLDTPDSTNNFLSCEESASSCTASSSNEMVLKFGPESPHCDSTPTLVSQSQRSGCSGVDVRNNELHDNGSLPCASPLTGSSAREGRINNELSLQQPLYHYTVPQHITAMIPNTSSSSPLAVPGCNPHNVGFQFVPASYLNYIPVLVTGSGNISMAVSNGCLSSPFFGGGNGVQVLGKHPRDTHATEEQTMDMGLLPSKTVRIREVEEA